MSRRRRAAKRTKRPPFLPVFHDLEKRLMPATFVVLNTADSGAGSLRQAILDSNAAPGLNTIDFSIGTVASQQTISPSTTFPDVTNPVLFDGESQGGAGYSGAPLLVLSGLAAGAGANGLVLGAGSDGSTIRGLVIDNFAAAGIRLTSGDNLIQSCYIGTDITGTFAIGNDLGVENSASGNTIGGAGAGAGNLISGNSFGIDFDDYGANGNLITGNRVGTDASGASAIPNAIGIVIDAGQDNTIGGTTSAASNLISGNASIGIRIETGPEENNLVLGNLIGTDASGTKALSNATGVQIDNYMFSGTGNTIGGTSSGASNLISGNRLVGIRLTDAAANVIEGNRIGTNASGDGPIPNDTGVLIVNNSMKNIVGGTAAGSGNLISGNTSFGVETSGFASQDNVIAGNQIGTDFTGTIALANATGVELLAPAIRSAAQRLARATSSRATPTAAYQSIRLAIKSKEIESASMQPARRRSRTTRAWCSKHLTTPSAAPLPAQET